MSGGSKKTPTNNAWVILTPSVCGMAVILKLEPQTAFYLFTGFIAFLLGLIYLLSDSTSCQYFTSPLNFISLNLQSRFYIVYKIYYMYICQGTCILVLPLRTATLKALKDVCDSLLLLVL